MNKSKAWDGVLPGLIQNRARKPRGVGVTAVLDRCQGLNATEDLLELTGDYVDHIKLGFGTTVFLDDGLLRRKIEIIRARNIDVYPGGTLFEAAVFQGVCADYLHRACELGFTAVEVSDGTLDLPLKLRADVIRRAADMGLKVFTEVGKKDPGRQLSPAEMSDLIMLDLEMGADKVIVEAREAGVRVGIYDENGRVVEERLNVILAGLDGIDRVIWEAPLKHQHEYFVLRFGPNVNLGNIRPQEVLALEALRCALRFETLQQFVEHPERSDFPEVGDECGCSDGTSR
ncbi:MAG: phosphosulfolactate synthase [Ardenticatenaceae bacterium]|nr:phosphosulfolactate synthase [Ardenticatenaceae bacterium]HBY96487.1 phosphosulfolactate synthase [Chloroflexota bacterium]